MKDVKIYMLKRLSVVVIMCALLMGSYMIRRMLAENTDKLLKKDCQQQSPVKLLLVTFYRGGSSFLGQAFNLNPTAFYYYEPLASIYWKANLREYQLRRNEISVPATVVSEAIHHVHDLLNCRLADLPNTVFLWKSLHLSTYRECLRRNSSSSGAASTKTHCLNGVTARCQKSHVRAVKTIRMELSMLPHLLELDPDIKVVYYVRDPRGIIRSREMGTKLNNSIEIMSYLAREARGVCMRISRDLEELRRLKQVFTNIWLMKYENLAGDSAKVLSVLYGHLELGVPPTVSDWFNASAHGTNSDGITKTHRGSSVQIAEKWREDMPLYIEAMVSDVCKEALAQLGYA